MKTKIYPKLDVKHIIHTLNVGMYSVEEVNRIVSAVKNARDMCSRTAARSMSPGDAVEFEDKRGNIHRGVIMRINPKMTKVRVTNYVGVGGQTMWNVAHTLLKRVS